MGEGREVALTPVGSFAFFGSFFIGHLVILFFFLFVVTGGQELLCELFRSLVRASTHARLHLLAAKFR